MGGRRKHRNFNPANWLVGIGIATLFFSFWLPHATATRTARIEHRAARAAWLLFREATTLQPFSLDDPALPWVLEARVLGALGAEQVYPPAFVDEGGSCQVRNGQLTWRGKHYQYQLGVAPTGEQQAGSSLPAPIEVYAYPLSGVEGTQTTFFFSELHPPAFSRNLQSDYRADGNLPLPGAGSPLAAGQSDREGYRAEDDERWLYLPRGALDR